MLSYGNVVRHRHTCIGTAFRLKPKMLIFQGKQTEITCQNGHRKKKEEAKSKAHPSWSNVENTVHSVLW